jgi:hypothetical protein
MLYGIQAHQATSRPARLYRRGNDEVLDGGVYTTVSTPGCKFHRFSFNPMDVEVWNSIT